MTIESNVAAGFAAVAVSVRGLRTAITGTPTGNLNGLATTNKANLIAAINELYDAFTNFREMIIDDADADALDSTYSSSKIEDRLLEVKESIIGGASSAYDTLQELQALAEGEAASIASLVSAVGFRVRFDEVQTISAEQKHIARGNIGASSQTDMTKAQADIVSNTGRISALELTTGAHQTSLDNAAAFDYAATYNTALSAA